MSPPELSSAALRAHIAILEASLKDCPPDDPAEYKALLNEIDSLTSLIAVKELDEGGIDL